MSAFTKGLSKPRWEKRWASIVETCRKLSSLFYFFRSAWSEEKFQSAEVRGQTRDTKLQPDAVSRVVADETWWAYLQVLFELQDCLHSLSQWCDGCACLLSVTLPTQKPLNSMLIFPAVSGKNKFLELGLGSSRVWRPRILASWAHKQHLVSFPISLWK